MSLFYAFFIFGKSSPSSGFYSFKLWSVQCTGQFIIFGRTIKCRAFPPQFDLQWYSDEPFPWCLWRAVSPTWGQSVCLLPSPSDKTQMFHFSLHFFSAPIKIICRSFPGLIPSNTQCFHFFAVSIFIPGFSSKNSFRFHSAFLTSVGHSVDIVCRLSRKCGLVCVLCDCL